MPTGTLVVWDDAKACGFLRGDDVTRTDRDVYVIRREMERAGVCDPRPGDAFVWANMLHNGRQRAAALHRIHLASMG